jgi:hypothetical protein
MGLLNNLMSKIFSHSGATVATTGGASAAPAAAPSTGGTQPAAAPAPATAAPAVPAKPVDVAAILDGLAGKKLRKTRLEKIDCGSSGTTQLIESPVRGQSRLKGARLNGANHYTVTFAKDQTPPVNGFWSLTLYDEHHFFVRNEIKRYSLGTKNKTLRYNQDGSLTIHAQADQPAEAQLANWLPAPKNADFVLFMRAYWPKTPVIDGTWTPPAVEKAK